MKKIAQFCWRVLKRFYTDNCPSRAASLAFTSLLALVPLMAVSFSIVSALPQFEGITDRIQDIIFNVFVAESAQVVEQQLLFFVEQASKLSWHSLIFLVFTAVLMIVNIEQAFNDIWRVPKKRHGLIAFLLYFSILIVVPIIIGLGLLLSSYLISLAPVTDFLARLGLNEILLTLAPIIAAWLAFSLLYLFVPHTRVPIKAASLGGLVAMVLFEIAKYGFGLYLTYFPTYSILYGALAIIPIFFLWVYLAWIIVLIGAVVSHEMMPKVNAAKIDSE